tara:strand:+ start:419 stop:544 length:126 start_codon:yes stop_codon:yes gene_type:complete
MSKYKEEEQMEEYIKYHAKKKDLKVLIKNLENIIAVIKQHI